MSEVKRRRAATPGPSTVRQPATQEVLQRPAHLPAPLPEEAASALLQGQLQSLKRPVAGNLKSTADLKDSRNASSCAGIISAVFVLVSGLLILVLGDIEANRRAEHIAIFHQLLSQSDSSLPLPEGLARNPPTNIEASWEVSVQLENGLEVKTFHEPFKFDLSLTEVNVSSSVLGDIGDAEDPLPLFFAARNASANDKQSQSIPTSRFYRAVIPLNTLLRAVESKSQLRPEIAVPTAKLTLRSNNELLMVHRLEPFRWLPTNDAASAKCRSLGGNFDDSTQRCSQRHVLVRLCYAVSTEQTPWDSSLVSGCEYDHRSPQYVPMAKTDTNLMLEVILRRRTDPYLLASEVTRGCSNCHGKPLGEAGIPGRDSFACSKVSGSSFSARTALSSYCFGIPRRWSLVAGIALLGVGFIGIGASL